MMDKALILKVKTAHIGNRDEAIQIKYTNVPTLSL